METIVSAPTAGTVKKIHLAAGVMVEQDDLVWGWSELFGGLLLEEAELQLVTINTSISDQRCVLV